MVPLRMAMDGHEFIISSRKTTKASKLFGDPQVKWKKDNTEQR